MTFRAASLVVAAAFSLATGSSVLAAAPPEITVSVELPDGSPAANATIFLNGTQVEADGAGRWQGIAPGLGRLYESAAAPGYVSRGIQWVDQVTPPLVGSPGTRLIITTSPIVDRLESVFDVVNAYPPGAVPPTITAFTSDTGLERQQVLPAEASALSISGTVGNAGGSPLVRSDGWLALPDDSVQQIPVAVGPEMFSVTFPLEHGPGRYQVEVNDSSGGAVLNVPIFVGVPYAADPHPIPTNDLAPDDGAVQAFDALNQLRQDHGLPPVTADPRLTAIARDHVADQEAHHWYCHCWADGTSIFDHVRAAGIAVRNRPADATGRYIVGVGEGFSGTQGAAAIASLFNSPGHRHDLLGAWSHVGMASAPGDLPILVIEYVDEIDGP